MTLPDNYPLEPRGVDDYPVKVGSMLLTLVDPHKGYESAYNRWYERDHYIAGCLIGPYNFAGSRWVATREMKDLRWGTDAVARRWMPGPYVAIYWLEAGHHEDWDAWALTQVRSLYADGRGFNERSHVHTVTFDHVGADYRDADPVPVELALDHGYDAIVGVWLDGRGGVDAAGLHARLRDTGALKELLDGGDVEIASSWTPRPEFRNSRDSAPMSLGITRAARRTGCASCSSSAATCALRCRASAPTPTGWPRRASRTRCWSRRSCAPSSALTRTSTSCGDAVVTTSGRSVVVTGAAGGLGAATVRRLAASGWRVFAADLDSSALAGLASPTVTPVVVDVTDSGFGRRDAGGRGCVGRSAGRAGDLRRSRRRRSARRDLRRRLPSGARRQRARVRISLCGTCFRCCTPRVAGSC